MLAGGSFTAGCLAAVESEGGSHGRYVDEAAHLHNSNCFYVYKRWTEHGRKHTARIEECNA